MARMEIQTSGSGNFTGIIEVGILSIIDKSNDYDWSDWAMQIEFQGDTEFPHRLTYAADYDSGSVAFPRNPDGTLRQTKLLKNLQHLFNTCFPTLNLGVDANTGNFLWGDDDKEIKPENLAPFLSQKNEELYGETFPAPKKEWLIYTYRGKPSKNTGKQYINVWPLSIRPNDVRGREDLEDAVKRLNAQGMLVNQPRMEAPNDINDGSTTGTGPDIF